MKSRLPEMVLALLAIVAVVFAVGRWSDWRETSNELTQRSQDMAEIKKLLATQPELLACTAPNSKNAGPSSTPADLKPLVQQACARHGVHLVYLADSEKDAGKGVRERDVLTRLADVNHGALVRFLAELEARSGGAKVKELRAHPSSGNSDVYKDAEVVLAQRWALDNTSIGNKSGKERAE